LLELLDQRGHQCTDRLGIDQEMAEALATELDAAHLVRVCGDHSVTLAEAGRRLATDAAKPQPSSGRQRRQTAGTSAPGGRQPWQRKASPLMMDQGGRSSRTSLISQGGTHPQQ